MTHSAPKPLRRRWWNYLFQFSLRTLLIVVTLVAVGCWWFLMPEAREEDLAGKYLKLRCEVRVNEAAAETLTADDNRRFVSHGAWRVRDQHGDLLIDGRYSGDERHGKWTTYHANGQKAAEGLVFRGVRSGLWRTWDESGTLRSEVTYQAVEWGQRPVPRPPVSLLPLAMIDLPLAQFGGGGMLGGGLPSPPWQPGYESIRHGPAKQWHTNRQLHFEGAYQDDLREGPWAFYDEQGRVTAQGNFRAGLRDGAWQIADASSPQPRTCEYQSGLPKDDLQPLIVALGQQLAGGNINAMIAAAQRLEQLGAAAVPCLLHALNSNDPEVQLLALRTLTRQNALPESALPTVAALLDHSDPRLALRARLAIFLAQPSERTRLFGPLIASLESAGDEAASEALLAMYRADPDRRLAILAPLIERAGRAQAESGQMLTAAERKIADLGWDVIPLLETLYPQVSSEARWFAVVVLVDLLNREPPTRVETSPGQIVWKREIPQQSQALLARALADPDPRVKEIAELVGQQGGSGYLGPNYGGGLGGGGGFF